MYFDGFFQTEASDKVFEYLVFMIEGYVQEKHSI